MKDYMLALLREVPPEKVLWRTLDLDYPEVTAADLIREVTNDTYMGKMWVSELLRVSRDFIARRPPASWDAALKVLSKVPNIETHPEDRLEYVETTTNANITTYVFKEKKS